MVNIQRFLFKLRFYHYETTICRRFAVRFCRYGIIRKTVFLKAQVKPLKNIYDEVNFK